MLMKNRRAEGLTPSAESPRVSLRHNLFALACQKGSRQKEERVLRHASGGEIPL